MQIKDLVLMSIIIIALTAFSVLAAAQEAESGDSPESTVTTKPATSQDSAELTLWNMIREGGTILWVIMGLGTIAMAMALYLFLTVTCAKEAPSSLVKRAFGQIKAGEFRGAYQMCEDRGELLARVLSAGLKVHDHDRYVVQEAMESEGERGATELWQRISYLNNIGTIAPLLGLLGTVWGMINAFGSIAMEDSSAKGLAMAYHVSQAMITTAAGLLVAIPAMVVYYYLRGRVVRIIADIEEHSTEFMELITRSHSQ